MRSNTKFSCFMFIKASVLSVLMATSFIDVAGATSLEPYVEKRTKANEPVKMILGCGHTAGDDYEQVPGRGPSSAHDIDGKGEFHKHIGWYTVDKNEACKPDLIGDIESDEIFSLLSQRPVFDLIYAEYLPPNVLTPKVLAAAYSSLRKGGRFIFQLMPKDMATSMYPTQVEKDQWISQYSRPDIKITIHDNLEKSVFNLKRAKRLGIKIQTPPYISCEQNGKDEFTVTFKSQEPFKSQGLTSVKFNVRENMQSHLSNFDEMFSTADIPFCYALAEKL